MLQQAVDTAIKTRSSIRAFLPTPVPRADIEAILELAARAPSGTNTQPWKVYVLQGASLQAVSDAVCTAHDRLAADPSLAEQFGEDKGYYPEKWFEPFIGRRRENGWGLYGLLGIQKGEKDKMHAQHQRNFRFFGAPLGFMFTIDRQMGRGSHIDYGMFLQNMMLAARARGLHTCPQAAWISFARVVLPIIGAPASEMLVCGMAMGHADPHDKVNTFYTPRTPIGQLTQWRD